MSIIKKGTPFGATEQVTSDKLNNLVDNASFTDTSANAVAYTGSTGTCLNGGGLEVTSAGQLQIKDADIPTAKLADDAVTQAKTSFIDASGNMTISGSNARVTLSRDGVGTAPFVTGLSSGDIEIAATQASSNVVLDGKSKVILQYNNTTTAEVGSHVAKDENGTSAAGAKVTGGLYVTGAVYVDDHVVADNLKLIGDTPHIIFDQDDVTAPNTSIGCGNATASLDMQVQKASGDALLSAPDQLLFRTCDTVDSDYDLTSNPYHIRFRVGKDNGKTAAGVDSMGAKVVGDLQVTGGMHLTNAAKIPTIQDNLTIQGSDPRLTFSMTGVGTAPIIHAVDTDGDLQILATQSGSNVVLDANNKVFLQYDNNTVFTVGSGEGRQADNTFVAGAKVDGALQVTGEANIGTTKLGTDSILASSPSNGDDSTKIATTAFVHNQTNRVFKEITEAGTALLSAQDTFVDMPSCDIDITANQANRRFLLSGMLGLGVGFAGTKFIFKWQYRKNGTGTWTDFTLPTNSGSRIIGHFEYGNRMDNNGALIGCCSYKVRTPQITHSGGDTINFKLVVADPSGNNTVKLNSSLTDATGADQTRVISQLEVEQL